MLKLELEPEDEARRQELLKEGIVDQRRSDTCKGVSRKFWIDKEQQSVIDTPAKEPRASRFKGVYANNSKHKPFCVRIAIDGKQKFMGGFPTEEEAAREFDRLRVEQGRRPVNFPADGAPSTPEPRRLPRATPAPEGLEDASAPVVRSEITPAPAARDLVAELAAAQAIATALRGLDDAAARRVLAFVLGSGD